MTSQEITLLQDTKGWLFEKGWQKGALGEANGPNCIVGALLLCDKSSHPEAVNRVAIALRDLTGGLVSFNNNPETTFDDIIDLLDLAIKNLENA